MYCTKQDLLDRFDEAELQTHAWDQNTNDFDDEKITKACQDATDEVNLYIGSVAVIDPQAIPTIIARIAADIARYHIQARRPLDETKERYKTAIKILQDIAAGRATLPVEAQQDTSGSVEALKGYDDRVFTDETLDAFVGD